MPGALLRVGSDARECLVRGTPFRRGRDRHRRRCEQRVSERDHSSPELDAPRLLGLSRAPADAECVELAERPPAPERGRSGPMRRSPPPSTTPWPPAAPRGATASAAELARLAEQELAEGPHSQHQCVRGLADRVVDDDVALVGGFPAGGAFSERDPDANPTVLQGSGETAVVEISEVSGIHVEGFRITGGGGRFDGYRDDGGGVFVDQTAAEVAIVGNRIDGNFADRGDEPYEAHGGGIATYGADVTIAANVIDGNRAGRGAGIAAVGTATSIELNRVTNNVSVGDHGGGIWAAGELTIVGNHIEGNRVGVDYSWGGGIIVFGDDTAASLRGNVVTDNFAVSAGSGVFVDDGADATLVGELYYANQCSYDGGHGLFVDTGGQTVTVVEATNITVAAHDCPDTALGGNAVLADTSGDAPEPPEVTIANSIFWGNGGGDVLALDANVRVTYTTSEEPIDGTGNLSEDPRFADPGSGDFHLQPGSPAIDAGDPSSSYDVEPQPNGGRIDLGHTGNTAEATVSS